MHLQYRRTTANVTLKTQKPPITFEFANSVDPDEVALDEPPHLDLHCLPYSLQIFNMQYGIA